MCFLERSSERDTSALKTRPVPKPNLTSSEPTSMPQMTYAPPPGPPPKYKQQEVAGSKQQEQYAPPPGPPPSRTPQHDWQTAVPDTSLLPPPPSVGYQVSHTNNATEAEAITAEQWLRARPLARPLNITKPASLTPHSTTLLLPPPPSFSGTIKALSQPGRYHVKTSSQNQDNCLTSSLPLYSVAAHSYQATHTVYFEVKLLPGSRSAEISLGLGYVAQPYPPFRLPGWERASLGVHGDDGHRYVNDKWGGRDFTQPFNKGETVGIGMTFTRKDKDQPPAYGEQQPMARVGKDHMDVMVFFTRNGKHDGGWDMHEELDAQEDLPIKGLEGTHDLYAAVGTFDAVEFEVRFAEEDWLYKP